MSPASGLFAGSFAPMSQVSAHCGREEESSSTPNICQSTVSIKNAKHASNPWERVRDSWESWLSLVTPQWGVTMQKHKTLQKIRTGFKSHLQHAAHDVALWWSMKPLVGSRVSCCSSLWGGEHGKLNLSMPLCHRCVPHSAGCRGRLCLLEFLYKSIYFLQLGLRLQPLIDCKNNRLVILGLKKKWAVGSDSECQWNSCSECACVFIVLAALKDPCLCRAPLLV